MVIASIPPTFVAASNANIQNQVEISVSSHEVLESLSQSTFLTLESTPQLSELKGDLKLFLDELFEKGYVKMEASDEQTRPLFVNSQGLIEQNLAVQLQSRGINKLVGMIHTPTPATPLCTQGEITERLVHPSMQGDENRLNTVRARANIIRDYIDLGGQLFIVYPQGGFEKRTQQQQSVYLSTLSEYDNKGLFDCQLPIAQMDSDMVGATYLFEDTKGKQYLFGIKASQANAPEGQKTWEMWLGPIDQTEISARLNRVQSFLTDSHAPALTL